MEGTIKTTTGNIDRQGTNASESAGNNSGGSSSRRKQTNLNETLKTAYIDVRPDDNSIMANLTRTIAGIVGHLFTPRKMLIILRVLKTVTFGFLALSIMADLMYIVFIKMNASDEVNQKVGGSRDTIIRLYGILMTCIALAIELDVHSWIKAFPILKGFVPRALLLFFISTITNSDPLHQGRTSASQSDHNDDNDDNAYSDYNDAIDQEYHDQKVSQEIPSSTVVFQMVTSWFLGVCAIIYLILGCLCFDRFRSKAFLSSRDPLHSTAIPMSTTATSIQPQQADANNYHNMDQLQNQRQVV